MPALKAILFDLGGTLWDDYPTELYQWGYLAAVLRDEYGINVTLSDFISKSREVIASYCPSLTRAMVFQFLDGDLLQYRALIDRLIEHTGELFEDPAEFRRLNPLFPDVPEMLEELARRWPLAVVSQHFARVEQWMTAYDLGQYFCHLSLSGKEKLYKPDTRIFLHCCSALAAAPDEVLMVGDRLDNDIWPANRLGMTTVRVLSDPYRIQQPRYHTDVPDYTIGRTVELSAVLHGIEGRSARRDQIE